jgi:hypothetical protein
MKQGQATKSGAAGQKREPISKAVNPGGADQLGQAIAAGYPRAVTSLIKGPGFTAPEPAGRTIHKHGSQGRH